MKTLKHMISFAIYLLVWIFAFKLFDVYLKKYEYTDDTQLCPECGAVRPMVVKEVE